MFFQFSIFLFALIGLPDWWIFRVMKKKNSGFWSFVFLLLPSVVSVGLLISLLCGVRSLVAFKCLFLLLILISVPKLVYALVSVGGHLLRRLFRREWEHTDRVAFFFACVIGIVQYFGLTVGNRMLDVNRVTLASPLLPKGFDGFRVVQLSDLHVGTYFGDTTFVSAIVDSVNNLHPDLIVFTGDLINVTPEEVRPEFVEILSRLKAPYGVHSVLGNHDFCIYGGIRSEQEVRQATAEVVRLEKSMGWDVLRNEHRQLVCGGDTLVLAGTDNVAKPRPRREGEYVPPAGSLKQALHGVSSSPRVLLLTHDPWHWRREVTSDPRVLFTLAGHTHALHLRFGSFSPAVWLMPEWGGKYVSPNGVLYVSTGLGGSVPYRLGAWPAIELITLRKGHAAE